MTGYPIWICRECGDKYGQRPVGIASWHVNNCGVCGKRSWVTEPRDYGHLRDEWRNSEPLKGGE